MGKWSLLLGVSLCIAVTVQGQDAGADKVENVDGKNIMSFDACKEDIHRLCTQSGKQVDLKSDIAILECLQDAGHSESETLTKQCESLVWQFKIKLTQDTRFIDSAKNYCKDELAANYTMNACVSLTEPGFALSCLLDFVASLNKTTQCYAFLSRTERLAFSDFRLIGPFVKKCSSAIEKFGCGSLTPHAAHKGVRVPHTQGMALECLIEKVVKSAKNERDAMEVLDSECRHEVMRLAEMQADDFHLDRPLFFACRNAREKFCKEVPTGQGKVFECLMFNRNDQFMDRDCATVLAERAYFMGRDYRMAHPLTKACEPEMKLYNCLPQNHLESAVHFHMTWILLCLETAAHSEEQKTKPSAECTHEMATHRQLIMSEFRMAPELVLNCASEIDQWCSPRGDIEAEGRTLHCLMEHAQTRNETIKIGDKCMQALGQVIKVADIGTNYKVDKVLYASCRSLIDGKCARDAQSETSTLTCLMRSVDSPDMTRECEQRLLEVQYFMARDWTLDPQLYDACHKEAEKRCSAMPNWHMNANPSNQVDPGPQVLACLYRSAYDEAAPLSQRCGAEVRRVLHSRAARVNLMPEIEDSCRNALSEYCSRDVRPMEEMNCLQSHFEKQDFIVRHNQCHKELVKFTQMEAKDTKLNRVLMKACNPVIQAHCAHLVNQDIDHGDVLECLANNKESPQMTSRCHSYVNHFELISLRDYHFSYRFQQACQADITKHCGDRGPDKGEIIRCLSEVRFEHKVLGNPVDLAQDCRKQLKVAYLQQEQVEFDDKEHMLEADPKLAEKCSQEIRKFRCDAAKSFEDTVECLRKNYEQLGPSCQSMVFYREKIEAVDNTMDDELQTKCKYDIGKFCAGQNGENVLQCLTDHKILRRLQRECQVVVSERMREAARDVRLRPSLLLACKTEAEVYCKEDLAKINMPQYAQKTLEGVVISCLREKYRKSAHEDKIVITAKCEEEITKTIVEAEYDPQFDPPLYRACEKTITKQCASEVIAKSGQYETVLDCLKGEFYKGLVRDDNCNKELARRTEESMVDIHLDPSLHEACSQDINRFCRDVQPGHSRVIMCLMDTLESGNQKISPSCIAKLHDRNKLWMKAHDQFQMQMPENWRDVVDIVANHPQRLSILGWFAGVVFFLFIVGCCCGRVTKRTHMELKNR